MHTLSSMVNLLVSLLIILNLVVLYLHLRKPLDTANHAILLTKLNHYGIRGNVHEWFKSIVFIPQRAIYDCKWS